MESLYVSESSQREPSDEDGAGRQSAGTLSPWQKEIFTKLLTFLTIWTSKHSFCLRDNFYLIKAWVINWDISMMDSQLILIRYYTEQSWEAGFCCVRFMSCAPGLCFSVLLGKGGHQPPITYGAGMWEDKKCWRMGHTRALDSLRVNISTFQLVSIPCITMHT